MDFLSVYLVLVVVLDHVRRAFSTHMN